MVYQFDVGLYCLHRDDFRQQLVVRHYLLCIGSAFLCYGSIDLMKEKKKEEEDNRKDGEDKAE